MSTAERLLSKQPKTTVQTVRLVDVELPVELPEELEVARRDGRLVLFVGAGASIPTPSDLPSYRGLVERIATESRVHYEEDALKQPDELLDRIQAGGVDVHLRISDIIGDPDSRPSETHKAIIDLATAPCSVPRIVTTNYDLHLSDLLPDEFDQYAAPALPEGHDFTGLVYLHGSVRKDPRHLIATKNDLGRAYLDPARATMFLKELFASHTVLFVGYGLNDTLMQYFIGALPTDETRLYTLTTKPDDPSWERCGVVAIDCVDHETLPRIIRRWADLSRMEVPDHESRVRAIVTGAPPLPPPDESYLSSVVADPDRVGLFTSYARGARWLRWIGSKPPFEQLFNPQAQLDPVHRELLRWFAESHTHDDDTAAEGLLLLAANGGLLHEDLWYRMVERFPSAEGGRSAEIERWISVLVETMPPGCNDWLSHLLDGCRLPQDRDTVLFLFDRITEPRLIVSLGNVASRTDGSPLKVVGSSARVVGSSMVVVAGPQKPRLQQRVREVVTSDLDELALDVAPIVDNNLRQLHRLLKIYNIIDEWKDSSTVRPAIENHAQNDPHTRLDCLIDTARDVLEHLVREHPDVGAGYIRSWEQSEWSLLRRLALHGWIERDDVTADDKLAMLLKSHALLDRDLHHEVMRLLSSAAPLATSSSVNALVKRIERIENESAGPHDRWAYCLLGWIGRYSPSPEPSGASEAFARAQARNPDWQVPDGADFLALRVTATRVEDLNQVDLHGRIASDADQAVSDLLDLDRVAGWGQFGFADALQALRAGVATHPDDGIAVLGVLASSRDSDPHLERELAKAAMRGLERAHLDRAQSERVRAILPSIWDAGVRRWGHGVTEVEHSNWLEVAADDWAGSLAELWLKALAAEWRAAHASRSDEEDHSNMDGRARAALDQAKPLLLEVIDSDNPASRFAQTVLAPRLPMFFSIDEQWCRTHMLPMFDPLVDADRAMRCWSGCLRQMWSPLILDAGLLDHFVQLTSRISKYPRNLRTDYAHMAADLCVSGSTSTSTAWLHDLIAKSDIDTRVAWSKAIAASLGRMPSAEADAQWTGWIRGYWQDRLRSIPVAMTIEEASMLAWWALYLNEAFPEAVDLATQFEARIIKESRILEEIVEIGDDPQPDTHTDHLSAHPEALARLLTHLLKNTPTGPSNSYLWPVPVILVQLNQILDHRRMTPLIYELPRLGLTELVERLHSHTDSDREQEAASRTPLS